MVKALLTGYVVIKWFGAWSLYSGVAQIFLYSGLCIFALTSFLVSLVSPSALRALSVLIGDEPGGYGVLVTPSLWILFFVFYPLGLVDWLVNLHILDTNQGYLLSHQTPSDFDIFMLILLVLMSLPTVLKLRKLLKKSE
jgi:hypothetical protein